MRRRLLVAFIGLVLCSLALTWTGIRLMSGIQATALAPRQTAGQATAVAAAEARPLFGPWGMFFLGTRLVVGLALPLLFAWMARSSLRLGNTRSATGILYASTVLVLIGAAISISLQDTYGIPL